MKSLAGILRKDLSPVHWVSLAATHAQPYPSDEHQAARYRAQQLSMLARLGMTTVPAQWLGGVMLAHTVHDRSPAFSIWWIAALTLLSMGALLRLKGNLNIHEATRLNLRVGCLVVIGVAGFWGALPLATLSKIGTTEQLLVLLGMVCMTSTGAVIFQYLPMAAMAWVLILTSSTAISILDSGLPHGIEMSCIGVLYSMIMIRNILVSSRLFFARLSMSERERMQAQITARQAQIGQNISNCVLLLDRAGRITWVNLGFTRCLGYHEREVMGHSPGEWLDQEERQTITLALWRSLATRQHAQAELKCRHKNGEWVWLQVDMKCLFNDQRSREYVVVANDISQFKRAAQALQAEQKRQSHIIDGTHCGTWEVDFDVGVCKLGGHWRDIIGVDTSPPLVAEGSYLIERIHPDDRAGHQDAIRRYIKGLAPQYAHEHRLRHEDGSWHWVGARGKASAHDPDGKIIQMSGISMSISKSKATELALIEATRLAKQANHAKSLFLATMSHEIRTPMNGVIGTAEWLKATRLDDEQRDGIQTIVDSGRSLLTIIDDILDFTKIDAGRMKLEEIPMSLLDMAEGVADAIAPVAISKNVDLHFFIDPRLPSQVMGDPHRLRQVLFNLVGNAVKFSAGTDQRRGQVDVHILSSDDDSPTWQMHVSDDGIGMSQDTLRGLFKPFSQAEASTTRRFGGTGLGLAICHRLVELMGGGIVAHSVPGHGSTFIATLPMLAPDEAKPDAATGIDLRGVACLLLPGQHYRCDSLAAYLEFAGADVHWCPTPQEAQRVCAGLDLVVMIGDTPSETGASTADVESMGWIEGHDVRHLWIDRHRHGPLQIVSPRIGQLGRAHVRDLLRAVAVLAGRRSPELLNNEGSEFDAFCAERGHEPQRPQDHKHLILIAEDDATNQKVIRRQLQILGYACEVAGDGRAAMTLWRTGRFDILLSDLHMPEMDGYELSEQIRALEAEENSPRMPILALTANALAGEAVRARACGMDDYLTKPIALKELHSALKQWLPDKGAAPDDQPPPAWPAADAISMDHVDLAVLRRLVGDDEELIQELLLDFVTSSRSIGDALALAAQTEAGDQIGKLAHQLKSAARSVGALRLGQLCEACEVSANSSDLKANPVRALMQELHLVQLQLDNQIKEPIK